MTTHTSEQRLADELGKIAIVKGLAASIILAQDEAIELSLAALLAREHIAIVGPQGEGKTLLAQTLAALIGVNAFYRLLSRFSTPDEILGGLDLLKLQNEGEYARRTDRALPSHEVGILDEIFKCNSPTLNALLEILNEGTCEGKPAVTSLVLGLSNEWPRGIETLERRGDEESLLPLWDRFAIRYEIKQPESADVLRSVLTGSMGCLPDEPIELDLETLRAEVDRRVNSLPDDIVDALLDTFAELGASNVKISTRRLRKAARVVASISVVRGRDKVDRQDLAVLRHVLWNTPDERPKVSEIVLGNVDPVLAFALAAEGELLTRAQELTKTTAADRREPEWLADASGLSRDIAQALKEIGAEQSFRADSTSSPEVIRAIASLSAARIDVQQAIIEVH